MEPIFRSFITSILVLVSSSIYSSTNNHFTSNDSLKTKKVLMIGNSFTFYWNLPQVIECMFQERNENITVDQKTIGGSNLAKHWILNKKEDYSIEKYEYLVLNDHSTNPLTNVDACGTYIRKFVKLAKENNSIPLIYGTWEYPYLKDISKNKKSNTMEILDSISRVNQAIYVPVGNAFKYLEESYPEINLYMDDNKHPSPNATYLAACVFYAMITGENPIGLPRRFEGENIDGKKIFYIITEKNIAPTIQKVANLITEDLR
jgi:hypothetical protein